MDATDGRRSFIGTIPGLFYAPNTASPPRREIEQNGAGEGGAFSR
jgi:hypothetical protein